MKAWISAVIIILLAGAIGFFYYMYVVITEPLTSRENAAINIAKEETNLEEVISVEYYHGRRSFQLIHGVNVEGEEIFVWIEELPESDNESEEENKPQIITRKKSEGLSENEVRSIAHSVLNVKQIKTIRLGVIGNTPIYEVVYLDNDDRHSFYYLTFEDGSYIRHYQFRKS